MEVSPRGGLNVLFGHRSQFWCRGVIWSDWELWMVSLCRICWLYP